MRILWAALLAACATLAPGLGWAQWPGRIEILSFPSRTVSGDRFLRGDPRGSEVLLGGELRLPLGVVGKVPAVVLIHGSGGIGAGPDFWARTLNEAGIAAFILDSFTGRGIVSTVEDQEQLNSLSMTVDAYRALDVLAKNPRIRADRIAVMGFSKGAVPAVYSAMNRFRAAYGGTAGNRFAAHIGFYRFCNVAYDNDTKVAPVPIRLFHGISDDYVNIAPCRAYVARLKQAGVDATLTEYPDSQHGFDSPTTPALFDVPKAQSTRNCNLKEVADGAVVEAETGQPFDIKTSPCVAIGAHVGHNAAATEQARVAVLAFVKDVLTK